MSDGKPCAVTRTMKFLLPGKASSGLAMLPSTHCFRTLAVELSPKPSTGGCKSASEVPSYPDFLPTCRQDNIMAGSLCTWLVFRSVKQRDGETLLNLLHSGVVFDI